MSAERQSDDAIVIDKLVKDFRLLWRGVKLRAVDHLSLSIPAGSTFGLLGPNGSGKSTTMKLLLGLQVATRGTCTVFGETGRSSLARSRIGYLPEAPYFYRFLSGWELVEQAAAFCNVAKNHRTQATETALDLTGMRPAAHRKVGTYSKGMLQRIGLARALVHEPDLLILDEPTAGLDPPGARQVADILQRLRGEGKTILLCSHLLAEVESLCDRIAILHKGKCLASGTLNELLREDAPADYVLHDPSAEALAHVRAIEGISLERRPTQRLSDYFLRKVTEADANTTEPS